MSFLLAAAPGRRLSLVLTLLVTLGGLPAGAAQRRAFVTSIAGTGNISSWPGAAGPTVLDKADSVCRALAAAADPNPLPNPATYRAWLSTTDIDAYCHVQGLSGKYDDGCGGAVLPGAGPWFLSNGLSIATAALDPLVERGENYQAISYDENFDLIPNSSSERTYWTGTEEDGEVYAGQTCGNWAVGTNAATGWGGDAYRGAGGWTASTGRPCDSPRRLLCVEPGLGDGAALGWLPGAIVFLSSALGVGELGQWQQAGAFEGVNAGYEICRTLATNAHLPAPQSFVPWLSTQFVAASSRVTAPGPFRRIDGFRVGSSVADLSDGSTNVGLYQLEDGSYLRGSSDGVWTGTLANGDSAPANCENWFTGDATAQGLQGLAGIDGLVLWTEEADVDCNIPKRLYCVSNTITLFWDGFEVTGDSSRWSDVGP